MGSLGMRAGDTIGDRFEIESLVAAGGMGRVYRARDRHTGQPVAVKLMAYEDQLVRDRFLYEAVVLAEIHHPGIVRYVAHGLTEAGDPYLAMEWLDGEDLAAHLGRLQREAARAASKDTIVDRPRATPASPVDPAAALSLDTEAPRSTPAPTIVAPAPPPQVGARVPPVPASRGKALTAGQVLQLGRRLASAVATLHGRGIVHRDIKPANVFLRGGSLEHAKLLDFGTVRNQATAARMTEPGRLVGTLNYMAPEQARTSGEVGPATDVWAIGCVLYECLTGTMAFPGHDILVVLTQILLEDPAPIRTLCREVPRPLADLVARAMAKNPADRFADAGALAEALDALGDAAGKSGPHARLTGQAPASDPRLAPVSLTAAETRVTCMLFASQPRARAGARAGARARTVADIDDTPLAGAVARHGGALQRLANGVLLVTIPDARAPTDQAARAGRAALALHESAPALVMVLATGRAEGPQQVPLAEVVSAAALTLGRVAPGRIHLDALTASLLDARFHIDRDAQGAALTGERQHEATRTLLGKPTRWVGRHRELATLLATFDECMADEEARAVLVTAPAGMGKSRLRYELEQTLRRRDHDFEVLRGQGDAVSAGSPFVMIAPAIRRLAGIRDGEPLADRQRKLRRRLAETVPPADQDRIAAFLGEMIGVPFPDDDNASLRAARKDPLFLGQRMQSAWEEWLRAECSHRPVLLLLEDLHWGDLPSVKYVDGALSALQDAPLMVLALARPEVHTAFPQLWSQRNVQELVLHSLSRKASLALVHDVLGPDVPADVAMAVVLRAGGNAFYLEELIRAVAEDGAGAGHLPETILGMVQARLDALGTEAKRILRAASIFGKVFWRGGVEALLGYGGAFDVGEWLGDLVAREVISRQPEARMPGEAEYRFRHALVRDGAYAMLTAEDRRLGHALAGAWLEQAGERDGLVLAEHFMRGGAPEQAIPCFQRAAEQALEGSDLAAALRRAERAVQAGAQGARLGALRALQSVAGYWLSDYAAGRRHGREAAKLLPAGSAEWFVAVGSAIVSSARLGDYAQVDALFAAAMEARCAPGAEAEQLICLCRGTFQLIFNGRFEQADQILARIVAVADQAPELDPRTTAQVNHVQGLREAHIGDMSAFMDHLAAVVTGFEQAGDLRNAALERTTWAWAWAELGYFTHAAALGERNLAACLAGGAKQAITYAKVNLGYILSYCDGRHAQARQLLCEAIAECCEVGNPRLEGWARAHLTRLEHLAGAHEAEAREAERAAALLAVSPGLRGWAQATHARALLALGRPAEALVHARKGMDTLTRLGGLLQGESLPPLMLARALHALGHDEVARAALADAVARLERRAARLPDPDWRVRFLAIDENRETHALARAWAVPAP